MLTTFSLHFLPMSQIYQIYLDFMLGFNSIFLQILKLLSFIPN